MLLHLGAERPLYRALTTALREAILDGRLAPGSRLPGTRALARELGISRIVALTAFEQLAAEGYIVSSVGAGSRVALGAPPRARKHVADESSRAQGRLSAYATRARGLMPHDAFVKPVRAPRGTVDFRYAAFVPEERTQRAWSRAVARAAADGDFDYPDASGLEALRRELCRHLRRHRGIEARPEDVLIVSGAQQALDLAARAVCDAGTRIAIEDPHYQGTRQAFLAAGARLVPCSVGAEGFDVRQHASKLGSVRAVYVTPSHQFPTGAVMTAERRLDLLEWANRRGAWVIEDDYDSEFHYGTGTIPALCGLDGGRSVIYVGTFARTLSPGLRLGYIVVPPALRDTFGAMKWLADRGSSPLEQRALASMMESGMYERAQRRMARMLAERRRTLIAALEASLGETGITWSGSGAHLFLRLPRLASRDADEFLAQAAKLGARLYNAAPYYLKPPRYATLLCGYTGLTSEEIERGVKRFAEAYGALGRSRAV